jgi:hypothetical protein
MKRRRRLEIVVATERRLVIRKPGLGPAVTCVQCSQPLVFAEVAVAATGVSSRAIHRLAEIGEIHFAETPAGALLVCLNSLKNGEGGPEIVISSKTRPTKAGR